MYQICIVLKQTQLSLSWYVHTVHLGVWKLWVVRCRDRRPGRVSSISCLWRREEQYGNKLCIGHQSFTEGEKAIFITWEWWFICEVPRGELFKNTDFRPRWRMCSRMLDREQRSAVRQRLLVDRRSKILPWLCLLNALSLMNVWRGYVLLNLFCY